MPSRQNIQNATRPKKRAQAAPFYAIYLATFLFAYHLALPLYINSSFLSSLVSEAAVGYIYAFSSLLAIIGLARYPKILRRFGNYKTILALLVIEALLLVTLALSSSAVLLVPVFILWQALITLGLFNLDVFLESFSDDRVTGSLRGTMLTILNLAILLGPLSVSAIMTDSQFGRVFLLSAVLLVPMWLLIARQFKTFKDPNYRHRPFIQSLGATFKDADLRHVFTTQFLLRFFYSWMVIYLPLYLSRHMQFSWSEIGTILTIMLVPFILLEIPAGKIADKKLGEKELTVAGFIITALFTAALPFVTISSFWVWAALLFGGRIGASFIEIMSESYFFKHVDSDDTDIIGVFRDTRPLAYLVAPFAASLLLAFVPLYYLFYILAGIMLFGAWDSFWMRDTK